EPIARHIAGLCIDPIIAQGASRAVGLITNCDGLRKYFSFATKFCSWHNPAAYPIYDGNVELQLLSKIQACQKVAFTRFPSESELCACGYFRSGGIAVLARYFRSSRAFSTAA
ncbi:MAG TPA: hypothetical protein VF311_03600, partial [Terriglobales bacterium]